MQVAKITWIPPYPSASITQDFLRPNRRCVESDARGFAFALRQTQTLFETLTVLYLNYH